MSVGSIVAHTVPTELTSTQFRRGAAYSAGLAVLWVVLALLRSRTTFHLAPLLAAAVFPIVVAWDGEDSYQQLTLASIGGLVVALIATSILALTGEMTGPSLLPFGGAVTESVLFAVVGTAAGFGIGAWRRSR